jgi:hypothetical protein
LSLILCLTKTATAGNIKDFIITATIFHGKRRKEEMSGKAG